MNTPRIPTPEAGDTPGNKIPSFSPSSRESASKRRERTVPCGGDTLAPGGKIPSQRLANASCAPVTAEVIEESPEGGAKPLTWPAEPPSWWREGTVYAPALFRRMGIPFTPPVTRASGTHLKPLGQHELDDDAKIPKFLRRQGVTSLTTHARPIASDREPSEGSPADQPSGFVPSILRRPENADLQRGAGVVTPPVTPSPAPPVTASVTPAVTAAPAVGSICPTCNCRVPARLSAAERQRAYRKRQRQQGKPVVP
jgi:hypothetical protein